MEDRFREEKPFYIAHNNADVFHFGELVEGQVISTGQPNLEFFKTELLQKERLLELGHVPMEEIE